MSLSQKIKHKFISPILRHIMVKILINSPTNTQKHYNNSICFPTLPFYNLMRQALMVGDFSKVD